MKSEKKRKGKKAKKGYCERSGFQLPFSALFHTAVWMRLCVLKGHIAPQMFKKDWSGPWCSDTASSNIAIQMQGSPRFKSPRPSSADIPFFLLFLREMLAPKNSLKSEMRRGEGRGVLNTASFNGASYPTNDSAHLHTIHPYIPTLHGFMD
jgi:hypothetical protein